MPDKIDFADPIENCPWRSPREILARCGYAPLPPTELDDRQLPGRLWELLYAAAARRFFFCNTDHLNDREFYTLLWRPWLDRTENISPKRRTRARVSDIQRTVFKVGNHPSMSRQLKTCPGNATKMDS